MTTEQTRNEREKHEKERKETKYEWVRGKEERNYIPHQI
jgi:hypothetical protein